MLSRLLREPLLHFLLLGGVLFLIFGRGGSRPPAGAEIVVTAADIQRIAAGFSVTWQRPPSENELQGAINDYIGVFSTTWKVPARGDYRLAIQPSYPEFCRQVGEPMTAQADSAFIERGRIRCDRLLAGSRILIRGLEATQTDVLVRIEGADGAVETERLTPSQPDFIVPARPSRLAV